MSFKLHNYQICLQQRPLFQPIELTVANAGVAAIVGPSGSGKSTLLADISGVMAPAFSSHGQILLNGQDLRLKAVEQRRVGLLFQDDLLFPHLNVQENLLFALPRQLSRADKKLA